MIHYAVVGLLYVIILSYALGGHSLKTNEQRTVSASQGQNYFVPQTFFIDSNLLAQAKKVFKSGENKGLLANEITRLILEANTYLKTKPPSVMDKGEVPPSGNKHDFLSLSPYRWPNPESQSGLPYVFRDGKTNPEIFNAPDKHNLDKVTVMIKTLSLAYYFTDNPQYAQKASELLRVWFLNDETRMNPNLNYSEIIRGKPEINPAGIIAGEYIPQIFDAISIIKNSLSWNKADEEGMQNWFNRYLDWLLSSESGKIASMKINNHGTYYYLQVSSIALFLDKQDIVKEAVQSMIQESAMSSFRNTPHLLSSKITPDGKQPFELSRTKSLDYSMFNLLGLFNMAEIGEHVGIDMWNYKTVQGAGLRNALDYLIPYALEDKVWPYEQLVPIRKEYLAPILCMASIKYGEYNSNHTYYSYYESLDPIRIPLGSGNYGICVKNQ